MRLSVPLKVPVMKRRSAPKVRPLPVPFPVPSISAMATNPLKSVMAEGSAPAPGSLIWNGAPGATVPEIGLGVPAPGAAAYASPGIHRLAVTATPLAAAAVPRNLRRDTALSQKCS